MFEVVVSYMILASIAAFIAFSIAVIFVKNRMLGLVSSSASLAIVAILSFYLLAVNYNAIILGFFHMYAFSLFFIMLFSIAMLLVNLLAYAYSKDYADLLMFLSMSFTGMFAVATATSILAIFLGLEMMAIITSFMILFEGKHRIEAAVKFFILSSVSIAALSFALVMLLPYNPQLSLAQPIQTPNLNGTAIVLLSLVLFAAAFGFDSALFPFNLWIPDVYEGSPTYITVLLAGINKKVAFVALMEVFFIVFLAYRAAFSPIFAMLSILTMFFGNILALVQRNVKRLFAYSSISQAGYITIGIAAATQFGIEASIFYIIAHAFMIIGAFSMVLWLESKNIKSIDEYNGLNSRNKFAAASLTMLMLSMAGIPPLMGFAGKFLLFSSAIDASIIPLAIFGVINSFISIYYYAKIINAMYSRKEEKALKMDSYVTVVVMASIAVIVLFGIYPQPIIAIASNASKAILGV